MTEFRPSRFQILPPVIKNLMIINGLVYLAQQTLSGPSIPFDFENTFALHAWQSPLFKPWQLLTHMFMHSTSDFFHILFNMLALWMFGSVLENVWGSKRFLIFYISCGLGAALIHLLFLNWEYMPMARDYAAIVSEGSNSIQPEAMIHFILKHHIRFQDTDSVINLIRANTDNGPILKAVFEKVTEAYYSNLNEGTIGASGAVFGVLAAFAYLFPNNRLYIYGLMPIKAKWAILIYGGIELFEGIRNSAGDNVAHWAHIGGAIVGLMIVITWNRTNKKRFY